MGVDAGRAGVMMQPIRQLKATQQVEPRDGVLALLVTLVYGALMFVELRLIPTDGLYIYRQIAVQAVWLLVIWLLARLRGQRLDSIGVTRDAVPIVATAVLTALVVGRALYVRNTEWVGRWFFYMIAVGGIEEVLFRGYLYPRLYRLFGRHWAAVLLMGMLFGAFHHIAPMVWQGAPWYGVFSELGGGVIGGFLFLWVYAATGNILNAVLLHAALDYTHCMTWPFWLCTAYVVAVCIYRYAKRRGSEV